MILLDTHVAIWLVSFPQKLSERAHAAIHEARQSGEMLGCAAASLYETAYLARVNRIPLRVSPENFIAAMRKRFDWRPLTAEIALRAAALQAPFHGDPMDRMIAATALVEGCTLITADEKIRAAKICKTLW
jgi:PIN domain nuclease of toxin-antitoxin system